MAGAATGVAQDTSVSAVKQGSGVSQSPKIFAKEFNEGHAKKTGPDSVRFSGWGYDDGMVLFVAKPKHHLKGIFSYKVTGKGDYKILFIDDSQGIQNETTLYEYRFEMAEDRHNLRFNIPKGTTKINVMAAGRLDINSGADVSIEMSRIAINPGQISVRISSGEMVVPSGLIPAQAGNSSWDLLEPTRITLPTGDRVMVDQITDFDGISYHLVGVQQITLPNFGKKKVKGVVYTNQINNVRTLSKIELDEAQKFALPSGAEFIFKGEMYFDHGGLSIIDGEHLERKVNATLPSGIKIESDRFEFAPKDDNMDKIMIKQVGDFRKAVVIMPNGQKIESGNLIGEDNGDLSAHVYDPINLMLPTGENVTFSGYLCINANGGLEKLLPDKTITVTAPTGDRISLKTDGALRDSDTHSISVAFDASGVKSIYVGEPALVTLPSGKKVKANHDIAFYPGGIISSIHSKKPFDISLPTGETAKVYSVEYFPDGKLKAAGFSYYNWDGFHNICLPTGEKAKVIKVEYFPSEKLRSVGVGAIGPYISLHMGDGSAVTATSQVTYDEDGKIESYK